MHATAHAYQLFFFGGDYLHPLRTPLPIIIVPSGTINPLSKRGVTQFRMLQHGHPTLIAI